MANEAKIEIKNNYLVVTDITTHEQFIRKPVDKVQYNRKSDDTFYFTDPTLATNNASLINQSVLGIKADGQGRGYFPFADIVDSTGAAYASADALEDFLSRNLGFFLAKRYEADVNYSSVNVQRTTALTLLAANEKRIGVTISNNGTQIIVVRFKAAATDNNIEGITVAAGGVLILDKIEYKGEISAIRLTASGSSTSQTDSMEW